VERVQASVVRSRLPGLLDRVKKGERLIITRDGKDVAMLGPIPPAEPMRAGVPAGPAPRLDPAAVDRVLGAAFPQKKRKTD